MLKHVIALLVLAVMPACDDEDDGDNDGTTSLPDGVTTASYTGADSAPEPEYVCEAGADCLDDSTCGDVMECVEFLMPERFNACARRCKSDLDCDVAGGTCDDELHVCMYADRSFSGRCV